ncbi:WecB/TagA/CpsF family glycosyltransferase [Patescibacteria group bacterium]|nr:WecB/TagA/CpsF family glycosyltransferase [Patescibacteria group bacterium]
MKFHKKNILGVGISEANKEEVLEYIITSLITDEEKHFIFTPNPELLVIAQSDKDFKNVLNEAKLALPDGVGVIIAGKLLKLGLKSRITGVDLVESLCDRVSEKPITVGFLGGRPGVAVKTAECLQKKSPGLKVSFISDEWHKDGFVAPYKHVDLLFVAFGSPKQELWIAENLNRLPVKVAIGVGGAFDFLSGRVARAPIVARKAGLEWLFRLIMEPWRIKRQLRLPKFVFLVLAQKFGKSFN